MVIYSFFHQNVCFGSLFCIDDIVDASLVDASLVVPSKIPMRLRLYTYLQLFGVCNFRSGTKLCSQNIEAQKKKRQKIVRFVLSILLFFSRFLSLSLTGEVNNAESTILFLWIIITNRLCLDL